MTLDMKKVMEVIGPLLIISFAVFAVLQIHNNAFLGGSALAANSQKADGGNSNALQNGAGVKEVNLQFRDYNYYPDTIRVKQGQKLRLVGDLDSENRLIGCYSFVRIPDLGIAKRLVQGDNVIEFTADKAGTINFACGMNMGRGQIIVEA